ncbi:hypothetical protein PVAP13_1KG219620 [Panicum virgatum]|uniref:Uncharacterized protein n=1 Tax=Panicum virgatum TaxID=38727 RepID=A0A8T0XA25_PANVG|nr:hypothetical protein PVAP13_1KG219620 [Panicum virgatum]
MPNRARLQSGPSSADQVGNRPKRTRTVLSCFASLRGRGECNPSDGRHPLSLLFPTSPPPERTAGRARGALALGAAPRWMMAGGSGLARERRVAWRPAARAVAGRQGTAAAAHGGTLATAHLWRHGENAEGCRCLL